MIEQPAKAVDDGEPEPESGFAIAIRFTQSVKLGKNGLAPIDRDSGPGIPDFDMHLVALSAAADDQPSGAGITYRV